MEINGIIHAHSTYSYDGKLSLAELKTLLIDKGMSFCCVTEHTDELTLERAQAFAQECRLLSDSRFVFIPGFEVPYLHAHILLIGTELFLAQKADAEILAQWASRTALTVLAHPVRNHFKVDSTLEEIIDGVEIWNQQYDGKRVPRMRSAVLLSELQAKRRTLLAFGGIDLHRSEHATAPVYTLTVDHLTVSAIVTALQEGTYTFGTKRVQVSSLGLWKGKGRVFHLLVGMVSVFLISAGKKTNAVLAHFGWKLPKGITKAIRSRL